MTNGRLTLAVAAAAALVLVPAAGAVSSKTIATATSTDFRADLVARSTGGGGAPSAVVTVVTYRRAARGWQRIGSRRVAGTYFWKTITGPRAICVFELASAGSAHVTAQLLVSPSTGCGKVTTVALPTR